MCLYPKEDHGVITGVNLLVVNKCWVCGFWCFSSQLHLNTFGFNQLKTVQICKHCAQEAMPGEILLAIAMNIGGFRIACATWNCYERFRLGVASAIKNLFEYRQCERSYDSPAPSS